MLVNLKLNVWKKLISKLKYFIRECKKKDAIIEAQNAQIKSIEENFIGTKNI